MKRSIMVSSIAVVGGVVLATQLHRPATATDYTAKTVMENLKDDQRNAYITGVIEGLAYARYAADGKKPEGMGCIYDWFYKDPKTLDLIYAAFGKYPDYTPGAVIAALVNRKCSR